MNTLLEARCDQAVPSPTRRNPSSHILVVDDDGEIRALSAEALVGFGYRVDEENPGRSGIILSLEDSDKEDGILQIAEIMRLKFNADLVTLSACRTGLGKLISGEGVLGLTRAFLYAGARSVQASLWNVNDTATAELMTAFYRNLKRGLPKDEALRQAKLELLHGKQLSWRHPYFWASFVLTGERN